MSEILIENNQEMAGKTKIKGLSYQYTKDGKVNWKFQFTDKDGKAQRIYLGVVDQNDAEYDAGYIGNLVNYSKHPAPFDPRTAIWIGEIRKRLPSFRKKLFELGLLPKTDEDERDEAISVAELCDRFEERYKEGNENTYKNIRQACIRLRIKYGDTKFVDIDEADVKKWEISMYNTDAQATASRLIKRFKQIAKWGVETGLIPSNPFKKMVVKKQSNPLRVQNDIDEDDVEKMMAACLDTQQELKFAIFMARYVACRIPSECKWWRWSFIDFKNKEFKVKRKNNKNGEVICTLPMFPYMYPFFAELFRFHGCEQFIEDSDGLGEKEIKELLIEKGNKYIEIMVSRFPVGEDHIFTTRFLERKNFDRQMKQLFKRSGVFWKKKFHNLRATCETEWVDNPDIGLRTATAWCGNTPEVALEHYSQGAAKKAMQKARGEDISETTVIKMIHFLNTTTEKDDLRLIGKLIKKYTMDHLQEMVIEAEKAVIESLTPPKRCWKKAKKKGSENDNCPLATDDN